MQMKTKSPSKLQEEICSGRVGEPATISSSKTSSQHEPIATKCTPCCPVGQLHGGESTGPNPGDPPWPLLPARSQQHLHVQSGMHNARARYLHADRKGDSKKRESISSKYMHPSLIYSISKWSRNKTKRNPEEVTHQCAFDWTQSWVHGSTVHSRKPDAHGLQPEISTGQGKHPRLE